MNGLRSIVVDKTGKVIFTDLADQESFSKSKIKPDEPMTACPCLVYRMSKVWDLSDPLSENAPKVKSLKGWISVQACLPRKKLPP